MVSEQAVFNNVSGVFPITTSIHIYHLQKDDSALHFHKIIEVGRCTKGCGTSVTGDLTHTFSAGDIHIVFPFQPHRNVAESSDCEWKWAFIDLFLLAARLGSSQAVITEMIEKISVYGIIRKDEYPALHAALAELIDEIESPAKSYRNERIFARLMLVLTDMTETPSPIGAPPVSIPVRFHAISAALMMLSDCLGHGEQPTVPELAARCSMPLSSFRRTFTAVMGIPPKRYIAVCAVQYAARLLLTTDHPVTDIASMTGFAEISTFNRSFKSIIGVSPYEYRSSGLSDFA